MNEEEIKSYIEQSHSSLAGSFSNLGATLAVILEKQNQTNEHLRILNGKAVTNANDINILKQEKTSILSSFRTVKYVGGVVAIIFTLLISVGGYAYTQDRTNLKTNIDNVASSLQNYQNSTIAKLQDLIDLLTKLSK